MSTALRTAPGHRLRADAAAAFDAANARRRWVLTDSERPLATQIRIFLERYLPARTGGGYYGDIRWWNGVRYVRKKGEAAAAVPGSSLHGTGTAIDVTGLGHVRSATWETFRRDVEPHGWRHPDWAKKPAFYEPWHWEYNPALDTQLVSSPGPGTGGSITTPTIPGRPAPITPEDDMTPEQDARLARIEAALSVPGQPYTWLPALNNKLGQVIDEIRGVATDVRAVRGAQQVPGQPFDYAPATHNAIARLIGEVGAIQATVTQLAAGVGDPAAIAAAARQGAADALTGITITVTAGGDPA